MNLPTCQQMREKSSEALNFEGDRQFMLYYKLILIEDMLNRSEGGEDWKIKKYVKTQLFIKNNYNKIIFELL